MHEQLSKYVRTCRIRIVVILFQQTEFNENVTKVTQELRIWNIKNVTHINLHPQLLWKLTGEYCVCVYFVILVLFEFYESSSRLLTKHQLLFTLKHEVEQRIIFYSLC